MSGMWMVEDDSGIGSFSSIFQNVRGKKIFCKYWEKEEKPRALVFLLHGLAEHCLPYENIARALALNGFYVFAHDHVGHGQSAGSRVCVQTFQYFVDDVLEHLDLMKRKFPGVPIFLCGHSMGGAIAILTALRKPEDIGGVVLISPAVAANPEVATPFKVMTARMLRSIMPKFPIGRMDYTLACSCPHNLKKMEQDPLRWHGQIRAGLGACLMDALKEIQGNLKTISFPFLLLQGEEDKLCLPQGAKSMYEQAISKDKTMKMYPKAYHSLLLEPHGIADQVISEIVEWLKSRTSQD